LEMMIEPWNMAGLHGIFTGIHLEIMDIPSGNLTICYWNSPCLIHVISCSVAMLNQHWKFHQRKWRSNQQKLWFHYHCSMNLGVFWILRFFSGLSWDFGCISLPTMPVDSEGPFSGAHMDQYQNMW
jgi:hypothetical protein